MYLSAMNTRLDKVDGLLEKLFDTLNDNQVVLERNTITVEQHHRRSLALEKLQMRSQKRADKAEKDLAEVRLATLNLANDIKDMRDEFTEVKTNMVTLNRWTTVFAGIPGFVKFLSLLCGFIIGAYGVYAIVKDSFTVFGH